MKRLLILFLILFTISCKTTPEPKEEVKEIPSTPKEVEVVEEEKEEVFEIKEEPAAIWTKIIESGGDEYVDRFGERGEVLSVYDKTLERHFPYFNSGAPVVKLSHESNIISTNGAKYVQMLTSIKDIDFLDETTPFMWIRSREVLNASGIGALKNRAIAVGTEKPASWYHALKIDKSIMLPNPQINLLSLFTDLKYLDLHYGFQVKDSDVTGSIATLTTLEYLDLAFCMNITDRAVVSGVSKLTNLEMLSLRGCTKLSDSAFISGVGKMQSLRKIDMSICIGATDRAIIYGLSYLTNLEYLNLSGVRGISDTGIDEGLSRMTGLTYLNISATGVTTKSVTNSLLKLTNLLVLNIGKTDLSEVALTEGLAKMKSLRYLDIWGVDVGESSVKALKEALPNCTIAH